MLHQIEYVANLLEWPKTLAGGVLRQWPPLNETNLRFSREPAKCVVEEDESRPT